MTMANEWIQPAFSRQVSNSNTEQSSMLRDEIRKIKGEIPVMHKMGSNPCLLYTSPSPRDLSTSRMPSSA